MYPLTLVEELLENGLTHYMNKYESSYFDIEKVNNVTWRTLAGELAKQLPENKRRQFVRECLETVDDPDIKIVPNSKLNRKLFQTDPEWKKTTECKLLARYYIESREFDIAGPMNDHPNKLVEAYSTYYLPRSTMNRCKTVELLHHLKYMENNRWDELSEESQETLKDTVAQLQARFKGWYKRDNFDPIAEPKRSLIEAVLIGPGFEQTGPVLDILFMILWSISVIRTTMRLARRMGRVPTQMGRTVANMTRQPNPLPKITLSDGQSIEFDPKGDNPNRPNSLYQIVVETLPRTFPKTYRRVITTEDRNEILIKGQQAFLRRLNELSNNPNYRVVFHDRQDDINEGNIGFKDLTPQNAITVYQNHGATDIQNTSQTGLSGGGANAGHNAGQRFKAYLEYHSGWRVVRDSLALATLGVSASIAHLPVLPGLLPGERTQMLASFQSIITAFLLIATGYPTYRTMQKTVDENYVPDGVVAKATAAATKLFAAGVVYQGVSMLKGALLQMAMVETGNVFWTTGLMGTVGAGVIAFFGLPITMTGVIGTFGVWASNQATGFARRQTIGTIMGAGQNLAGGYMNGFWQVVDKWQMVTGFFDKHVSTGMFVGVITAAGPLILVSVLYSYILHSIGRSVSLDGLGGQQDQIGTPARYYGHDYEDQYNLLRVFFANIRYSYQQLGFRNLRAAWTCNPWRLFTDAPMRVENMLRAVNTELGDIRVVPEELIPSGITQTSLPRTALATGVVSNVLLELYGAYLSWTMEPVAAPAQLVLTTTVQNGIINPSETFQNETSRILGAALESLQSRVKQVRSEKEWLDEIEKTAIVIQQEIEQVASEEVKTLRLTSDDRLAIKDNLLN